MSQKHTIAGMITRADGDATEAKSPAGPWRFIASTAKVDSYSDIVEQSWRLDRYNANPVILLQHSSWSLPIGKATSAKVEALADGHTAKHPGAFGIARLDINCTCVESVVVLEDEP